MNNQETTQRAANQTLSKIAISEGAFHRNLEIVWIIKVANKELHQVGAFVHQTLVNHGDVPGFMKDEIW